MKPAIIIGIFLMQLVVIVRAQQHQLRATEPIECSDLKPGQTITRKTTPLTTPSGARAYTSLTFHRDSDDMNADSCNVDYKLFVADDKKPFILVKKYSDSTGDTVGVEMVGLSKDGTKFAADFWWAAGDYTGHRPVIYDAQTKSVSFRELDMQIIDQLPSCDYFEEFIGVTDSGEAIIYVPKSVYVEKGCPSQGKWLFNLNTGHVRRMK